jgi:hypothetical protein
MAYGTPDRGRAYETVLLGWTERMKNSAAVIVTAARTLGFLEIFGIGVSEDTGNGMRRSVMWFEAARGA